MSKTDSRLKAFLENPNAASVHNVRTSIRRLRALADLLPKSIQKKSKPRNYINGARAFFKKTTEIRDIDVIEAKLRKYNSLQAMQAFLAGKAEKRSQLLRDAMMSATELSYAPIPAFKASQMSESKLSKRNKKIAKKYETRLETLAETILSSPTIEQLHDFRKNCKMLRYTIEIDLKKNDKKLALLGEFQRVLGLMVDDSAVLRCLSDSNLGELAAPIISELEASKEKSYKRFATLLRKSYARNVKIFSEK